MDSPNKYTVLGSGDNNTKFQTTFKQSLNRILCVLNSKNYACVRKVRCNRFIVIINLEAYQCIH